MVILRDLNYRGIDWLCKDGLAALDAISYEFIELCASCDFTQIVNKPNLGFFIEILHTDCIGISNSLCAMDWKEVFCGSHIMNEYWLNLYHILQQLLCDYVPVTVIRRHVTNRCQLPKDVRNTVLRKQKAWKRWQRTPNEDNKTAYNTVSRDCSRTLLPYKAKRVYLENKVKNYQFFCFLHILVLLFILHPMV